MRPGPWRKRIAIDDNICVAGLPDGSWRCFSSPPAMCPMIDATVATSDFLRPVVRSRARPPASGAASPAAATPVRRPCFVPNRTMTIALRCRLIIRESVWLLPLDADMALTTRQGGSIRNPASYCEVCRAETDLWARPLQRIASLEASIRSSAVQSPARPATMLFTWCHAGPEGSGAGGTGAAARIPVHRSPRGRRARAAHWAPQEGFGAGPPILIPRSTRRCLPRLGAWRPLARGRVGICLVAPQGDGHLGADHPRRRLPRPCGRAAASAPALAASPSSLAAASAAWREDPRTPRRPPHE